MASVPPPPPPPSSGAEQAGTYTYDLHEAEKEFADYATKVVSFDGNPELLNGHKVSAEVWYEDLVPVLFIDEIAHRSILLDVGTPLNQFIADNRETHGSLFLHERIVTRDGSICPNLPFTRSYFLTDFWKSVVRSISRMIHFFHERKIRVGPIGMDNLLVSSGNVMFQNLLLKKMPEIDPQSCQAIQSADYAFFRNFITGSLLLGNKSRDQAFQHFIGLLEFDPVSWTAPRFDHYIYNIQYHVSLLTWGELERFYLRCTDVQKYNILHGLEYDFDWVVNSMTTFDLETGTVQSDYLDWTQRIYALSPLEPLLQHYKYEGSGENHIHHLLKFIRNSIVHMFENNEDQIKLTLEQIIRLLEIVFPGFMADFQHKLVYTNLLKFVMEHDVPEV